MADSSIPARTQAPTSRCSAADLSGAGASSARRTADGSSPGGDQHGELRGDQHGELRGGSRIAATFGQSSAAVPARWSSSSYSLPWTALGGASTYPPADLKSR